jgi:hydrogenase maturation protein HypF
VSYRTRIQVTGVVQGVGFRPFVYRMATGAGLSGLVGNDGDGVFAELEGDQAAIDDVVARISAEAPPLAHIDTVTSRAIAPTGAPGFAIVASGPGAGGATFVSPDLDACADCLAELLDPDDRRYRYPFINCTNCGPRFTITLSTPYDRPATTMAGFAMCAACQAEYDDPADRRFHAQPNACPECGPHVWLEPTSNRPATADGEPIAEARRLVRNGAIIAVKGVGGFHLACDARSEAAVTELRARKHRSGKPFAVMVADLETARSIAVLSESEAALLASPRRPIVLADAVAGNGLSDGVAAGVARLGVMLPSSPLHHLLVEPGEVWVMTSGNVSAEPIVMDNDVARTALAPLADALLLHDRDIHVPCDDSVVRMIGVDELPVRRSRGYAPLPIRLGFDAMPTLAVGGELKATFCLASGRDAFMSQHIGDMENLETLSAFTRAVEHMESLFRIHPEVLVADLHPRYLSAGWAERTADGRPVVRVQHHHAHIASVMAEHRRSEPVIGFSFDGTGYGTDGTIWGGEVLVGDLSGFERAGHLAAAVLPGGDAAIRRPYRMALSHLHRAGIAWDEAIPSVAAAPAAERRAVLHQLETGLGSVDTTSVGRLFDAVASLAGIRHVVTYEGQAAMELEAIVDRADTGAYAFGLSDEGILDPTPALGALIADVLAGLPPAAVSARFHSGLAHAVAELAGRIGRETGVGTVALSGGVFQNVTLMEEVSRLVAADGMAVLRHRRVPPNDGGLALGQMALACHQKR